MIRPHVLDSCKSNCRWCGATRAEIEDNIAPLECESFNPVERVLIEASESLRAQIHHHDDCAKRLTDKAKEERALAAILEGHLVEIELRLTPQVKAA